MKYGRIEVRDKKNPLIPVLIVAVLITIIIVISAIYATREPAAELTEEPQINVSECVKKFGGYDSRIIEKEPGINWTVTDDFTPLDCDMDVHTQSFVYYLCDSYDIDWTLVMAMIKCESNFKADIISSTNDYGLMQINKVNHEWLSETLGIDDFLNPEQNIRAGVYVLRKLFEEYTDIDLVLMAYNMGENGASNLWDKGIYETGYSKQIKKYQSKFQEEGVNEG